MPSAHFGSRTLVLRAASLSLGLWLALTSGACSDSSHTREGGPSEAGRDRPPAVDQMSDKVPADLRAPDRGPDHGPFESCEQVSSTRCFSNLDCAAERRCENVGTEELPTPCCMIGPRGSKAAGEVCAGQNDCQSAVCITKESEPGAVARCSTTCTTPETCPATMKMCIFIVQSGSNDKWCFPE